MENSLPSTSIERIPDVLQQLRSRFKNEHEEHAGLDTLDSIFKDRSFNSLVRIHDRLQSSSEIEASCTLATTELVKEIQQINSQYPNNDILCALTATLESSPHLNALLSCYEKIASKTFDEPQLSDAHPDESVFQDENAEESIKVVRLVKSDEPLGATIAMDNYSGNIIIARILKGGAADRSGLIHVNDILVEMNGVEAKGKKPSEVIRLLAGFRGPLTFKLIPGEVPKEEPDETTYIRCRFTYLPQADSLIPCVEAGLSFYSGDILCIVSKEDNSWWQATKVESREKTKQSTNKVGLIPSLRLQTRREKLKRQSTMKPSTTGSIKGSNMSLLSQGRRNAWSAIRASFRRKRHNASHQSFDSARRVPYFSSYETVALYNPSEDRLNEQGIKMYRPIVLIGPQGVGRNDLKDRLIDSNPSHYGVPVPHTSRLQGSGEEDGRDYHFVTRDYMENSIRENRFLEYGEYKGNLYGTSLEAVRTVIKAGQVCVLTPYPQALTMLRTKEYMACVVFIKPPSVLEMGQLGGMDDIEGTKGKSMAAIPGRAISDGELRNLVSRADKMESIYGRLFDATIVNDNSDHAFNQLKELSFSLENDPQWVPFDWLT